MHSVLIDRSLRRCKHFIIEVFYEQNKKCFTRFRQFLLHFRFIVRQVGHSVCVCVRVVKIFISDYSTNKFLCSSASTTESH